MGFNREDIALVKEEIRRKNIRAKDEATEKLQKLEATIPGFREVERGFAEVGAKVIACAVDRTMTKEQRDAYLADLEDQRLKLTAEKHRLLTENGYPIDYAVPKYSCTACNDF